MKTYLAAAALCAFLFPLAPTAAQADPAPAPAAKPAAVRDIQHLGHNIYRFQNDNHYSVFILGKQSVLLTDPINADAATWLKSEINKRFGARTVKYVVYSHNHPDHVSGGDVFADAGTVIIAHEKAAQDLRRHHAPTAYPTLTFNDKLHIDFEGRDIQLAYYGPNNGLGSISLYVPDAKFLFVVDWIVLKRLPWREMYYYDLDGTIASLQQVLQLDFTLVSPGHSVTGSKEDVREFLSYLEALRSGVIDGMNAGKTREQIQQELRLPQFAHYAHYEEWLPLNIKGAYDQLERSSARFGQDK